MSIVIKFIQGSDTADVSMIEYIPVPPKGGVAENPSENTTTITRANLSTVIGDSITYATTYETCSFETFLDSNYIVLTIETSDVTVTSHCDNQLALQTTGTSAEDFIKVSDTFLGELQNLL